ncbi:MAG: TetR/AcrR family transcriptional regulator [Rhodobacterales bacterium]|jgi:TetR/AcrR family transcriptional regulator, copper-responsive repressor|nr:TetR/AcrR family transcriptional regulator [Pseudomonadota bacterium]MDA1286488.1 TetR/AcrR family transcriptional regulator [Pseudomonadota bacterium]NQW12766.1 TetR/AcrR family transcriptional regulator [Rhodobacter sp.]HBN31970.1 hypothetical protein [Paracoccaceae bacterium]
MNTESHRSRGRPLTFDQDEVLDAAMLVFWTRGYDAASLDDLTQAMGINRPSLYAQFGNKRGLFLAAIDRYTETISAPQAVPLATVQDIAKAVSLYYGEIIKCVAAEGRPPGCLIASVATELAARDGEIRSKVSNLLGAAEDFIETRLVAAGYGGTTLTAKVMAEMIVAVGQSLASRARLGATPAQLTALAEGFTQQIFADRPPEPLS